MVQLAFNAAQYEPSTGAADVLETGVYAVQIVQSEVKQTKNKDGYMLIFTMSCLEAPHTGRKIIARLNIHNPSQQAVEIAYRELSAISHVVGILNWQDTQQLHGRPFKVAITKVERADKPGSFSNDINAYMDYAGNPPNSQQAGGGSSPAPAAPQPPQQPQYAAPAPQPMQYAPAPAGFQQPAAQGTPATGAPAPAPEQQQPAWQQPAQQQAPAPQQQAAPAWQQPAQQQAPAPAAAPGGTPPWLQQA